MPSAITLSSPSGSSSVKHCGRFSTPFTTIRDRCRLSLSTRGVSVISQRASAPCGADGEILLERLAIALQDRAEAGQHAAQLWCAVESKASRPAACARDGNVLSMDFRHLLERPFHAAHERAILAMLEVTRDQDGFFQQSRVADLDETRRVWRWSRQSCEQRLRVGISRVQRGCRQREPDHCQSYCRSRSHKN